MSLTRHVRTCAQGRILRLTKARGSARHQRQTPPTLPRFASTAASASTGMKACHSSRKVGEPCHSVAEPHDSIADMHAWALPTSPGAGSEGATHCGQGTVSRWNLS